MFTVTFDSNGGSAVSDIQVESGKTITLPNNPTKDYHTFGGWLNADNTPFTAETTVTANSTVYAKWTHDLNIADTGPAGGLIFFVADTCDDYEFCYLEVAPKSEEDIIARWSSTAFDVTGTETAIGTGKANTQSIVAAAVLNSTNGTPAQVCNNLVFGGKDDWFLPSKDELNELYKFKTTPAGAGIISSSFWSSSQFDISNAWDQSFNTGNQTKFSKTAMVTHYVRPIRAF
jgi:uncharacterized repeat protein (TIGR02543 family)